MTTSMIRQGFQRVLDWSTKLHNGIDKSLLLITSLHILEIHEEVNTRHFSITDSPKQGKALQCVIWQSLLVL